MTGSFVGDYQAKLICLSACAFILAACNTGLGLSGRNANLSPSAAGASGYRIGEPYQIRGVWYSPEEDFTYDETGIASWYGNQFNGRPTASGEIFNSRAMTAAHTTLPLPSIVRVTNLSNGRSAVLRVNDRGPFTGGRIIDVSKSAAERLGFMTAGTARVRVQVLAEESRTLKYASTSGQPDRRGPVPQSSPRGDVVTADIGGSTSRPPVSQPPAPAEPIFDEGRTFGETYIQTGAYIEYDNALAARTRVSGLGLGPTLIEEATVNGRRYYRVRIGPMSSEQTANTVLNRNARRIPGALVVTN